MKNIKTILISPLLVVLAALAIVFTGEVQARTLTPADFPDLHLKASSGSIVIIRSDSIRISNGFLLAKVDHPPNGNDGPTFMVTTIELFDCVGSRSKLEVLTGTPANRPWQFITGNTLGSAQLDHVCHVGRKTGLIK